MRGSCLCKFLSRQVPGNSHTNSDLRQGASNLLLAYTCSISWVWPGLKNSSLKIIFFCAKRRFPRKIESLQNINICGDKIYCPKPLQIIDCAFEGVPLNKIGVVVHETLISLYWLEIRTGDITIKVKVIFVFKIKILLYHPTLNAYGCLIYLQSYRF